MAEKTILSIIGGKATRYIFNDKPSMYIPFKGNFPLAKEYQKEYIIDIIHGTHYFEDIEEEWVKEIIKKGAQIYDIETSFTTYLEKRNIRNEFLKLPASEKADILAEFMDAECLDMGALRI